MREDVAIYSVSLEFKTLSSCHSPASIFNPIHPNTLKQTILDIRWFGRRRNQEQEEGGRCQSHLHLLALRTSNIPHLSHYPPPSLCIIVNVISNEMHTSQVVGYNS